ncbi:aminotransferase class III-fold pyridoxal phosphate-dependent enzyme, partial [bacterium]|nr:aminotransferase class III-fold pyridoxal phosphate-dependent enzyme [bacterium]
MGSNFELWIIVGHIITQFFTKMDSFLELPCCGWYKCLVMNPSHHVVFSADSIMNTAARPQVIMETGLGSYLTDRSGKTYLDFIQGWAVNCLGHCPPEIIMALESQATRLINPSPGFYNQPMIDLADAIVAASCFDHVFFCNSGAEAWEATIKIARKYFKDKGQPDKWRGIVMRGCFHGRTFAGISAAMRPYMVDGFAPLVEGFDIVEPHDLAALEAAITPQTAYINLEPVLGEGGLLALEDEYLRGVRALCDKYDLLLVTDEVQCGMGRTGKLFAYEWAGIEPDIMALAKGLGCGFPIGAYVVGEKCKDTLTPTTHGSTFGGNPLACSVANAVLDVMTDDGFLEHVLLMGTRLDSGLVKIVQQFPQFLEPVIRGRGLMLAVQCKEEGGNQKLSDACFKEKLFTIPAMQNVLRIMPPLTITAAEVDEVLLRLSRSLAR